MNTLIVGMGEVGEALFNVLQEFYPCDCLDMNPEKSGGAEHLSHIDIMHICYPYTDQFIPDTMMYMKDFDPKYTVVHSTVPVGTCNQLQCTHSPIRGKHPFLEKAIKEMVKFIGGVNANEVAKYFMGASIRVIVCRNSDTTELGKILSTNYFATCIEFVKEAERICERNEVPFHEAFTLFQHTYNDGWEALGHPEYKRPILQPIQGPLGGHCIYSNLDLIPSSQFAGFVKGMSDGKEMMYGKEQGTDTRN